MQNVLQRAVHDGMAGEVLYLLTLKDSKFNTIGNIAAVIWEALSVNTADNADGGYQCVNGEKMIVIALVVLFKYHYRQICEGISRECQLLRRAYEAFLAAREDFFEETVALFALLMDGSIDLRFNRLILNVVDYVNQRNAEITATLIDQIWSHDARLGYTASGTPFTLTTLAECEDAYFTVEGVMESQQQKNARAKWMSRDICWLEVCSLRESMEYEDLTQQLAEASSQNEIVILTAQLCVLQGKDIPFFHAMYILVVNGVF